MFRIRKLLSHSITVFLLICAVHSVRADCGSIPFYAPVITAAVHLNSSQDGNGTGAEVEFDPLEVSVFEPKQRAIILWNGQEQILLLSTDQRSSQQSSVLEVIPLPSRPTVRLGSFNTFKLAQKLVVDKRMWAMAHTGAKAGEIKLPEAAGRVDFHQKMGAHDLTVTEVLRADAFVPYVQQMLKENYQTQQAPIREDFVKIIQSYIDEGVRWFAFDVIQMSDTNQSREPIEYRFASDHVYYPMRISTLERGKTEVELLVFSNKGASQFDGMARDDLNPLEPMDLPVGEVEGLEASWNGFFGKQQVVVMDQWHAKGKLETFVADIVVR